MKVARELAAALVSYPDRFRRLHFIYGVRPRVTQWRKMAGGRVGSGLRDYVAAASADDVTIYIMEGMKMSDRPTLVFCS